MQSLTIVPAVFISLLFMKPGLHPANEKARLKALKALNILDTPAEQDYDDIVRLACMVCGTPISLFSLVDENRLWFKASHGFSGTQISRDTSFCNYTILQSHILQVPDALEDPRFVNNPLVTGDTAIRFYAGMAVFSESGFPLGTLSVLDHTPRGLNEQQVFALETLAKQLQHLLTLRAKSADVKKSGTTVSLPIELEKGTQGTQDKLAAPQLPQADNAMMQGKKILLVDDSSMNRLVAATILKNYGAVVIEAANGREAIDHLKQTVTDLVLMDIQMPVMDGMEAAGIIRQNISKTIPIVALTANAIKGDNDKCIEAGMNGYLSKPFKESDLADTVAFWLNKTGLSVNHASPEMNVAALYDLSNMRALSRGNQQFVEKMIHMFIAQAPVQAVQLQEYFLQQQYKAMGNVAHSLKPVIDNMGIQSIKDTIREIEKQGKLEVADAGTAVLLNDVKNIIELVVTDLKIKFPETT